MPTTFEITAPGNIRFGAGSVNQVPGLVAGLGRRAFVVTGGTPDRSVPLIRRLESDGIVVTSFRITAEPVLADTLAGIEAARNSRSDVVVGMGGGSVIDAGKVFAAMLTNRGRLVDYLEVIGKGMPLTSRAAPYIAVPTTAGTGAEVTRNSVICSPEHRVKVSMRSPLMLPLFAVVDPELTYSMPPELTACTGMDALTQLLEAYVSKAAGPFTDGLCLTGLEQASRCLARAVSDGTDVSAREGMALASLFGGLALANAGLGAVHGLAGPLGGMFPAPHGSLCAALLPSVMAVNVRAMASRAPAAPALGRYHEVARTLTGQPDARVGDGVRWVADLCRALGICGLSSYGIEKRDFSAIAAKAKQASSMRANPVKLSTGEIEEILEGSFI